MSLAVAHSREFERIRALPRRTLSLDTAREWASFLTPILALKPEAELRPWQAQALAEAVQCDGAWLAMPVGLGKTLLSYLLPTVMQAERALLIVPASLHEKTLSDFATYAGVWRPPLHPLRIETREKIAVISGAEVLQDYAPDLLILDESDDLSNRASSTARRIDRYVRNSTARVVAMTGTPARKSLMAYWHLLAWCLGDNAPLPLREEEALMWALALDDHKQQRPSPGPLGASLKGAREWYRQRLIETPGVMAVDEDSAGDLPLTVRIRLAREDDTLNAAFRRFLVEQENPGGIPVSDPLSRWLLDAQLGLGLYTYWNPAPPEDWRLARRAVAKFVRERIAASTRTDNPLDTELQVLRRYADHPVVADWKELKPTFDGATETVWISRSAIDSCLDWLNELSSPGIVWCGSVDFGRALARETGLEYYGQRGQTEGGKTLYNAPTDKPFIASWNANKKGFNLQPWARQLITMPPQSAKWLEQIFGRSHRSGQTEPVVVDLLATSGGTLDAFAAAISEAATLKTTTSITQKLLRAEIIKAKPRINSTNAFRWAQRQG